MKPIRRPHLPELDAATVPRVALLGVTLSALALVLALGTLIVVIIGLGQKADRAEVRATRSEATTTALQLSTCRLAYRQQPDAPGVAPPATARGADIAPYWADFFEKAGCAGLNRREVERAVGPMPTPTTSRTPSPTPRPTG